MSQSKESTITAAGFEEVNDSWSTSTVSQERLPKRHGGVAVAVLSLDIADEHVYAVREVANPDELAHVARRAG